MGVLFKNNVGEEWSIIKNIKVLLQPHNLQVICWTAQHIIKAAFKKEMETS